jgi:hypothetical protein
VGREREVRIVRAIIYMVEVCRDINWDGRMVRYFYTGSWNENEYT